MRWGIVAVLVRYGMALIVWSLAMLGRTGDATREARLCWGYQHAGATLPHLAALFALLKLISGR